MSVENLEDIPNRFSLLRRIFKCLENPKHPTLGPQLNYLQLTGQWHPNTKSLVTRLKLAVLITIVIFYFSQYIKAFIQFNADAVKLLYRYAPFHVGILKVCVFQKDYKKWEKLIGHISSMERDQLAKKIKKLDSTMDDYIERCRKITYSFWIMALVTNTIMFAEPFQRGQTVNNSTCIYVNMFDGYVPFDPIEPPGCYVWLFIQATFGNLVSVYILGWDSLVMGSMICLAGQLRVACVLSKQLIDLDNAEQSQKNICDYHRFFTSLVSYQRMLQSLISPVMFVTLTVTSISLGVGIIQIAQAQQDLSARISNLVYLLACLVQLLLFYWNANEVTEESITVSYSLFESNWVGSDTKLQKELLLLEHTVKSRLIFKAGPFNEMSLATFLGILRASYSFYTLLNKTN